MQSRPRTGSGISEEKDRNGEYVDYMDDFQENRKEGGKRGRSLEDGEGEGEMEGDSDIITHRSKWAATALFEPVYLTSEKCKENFAAQLVIDIVPSLGNTCCYLYFFYYFSPFP